MKKLTAGIFATILGVTAMGAADAAIPSKGYVDTAVKGVADSVSTLETNVAKDYATKAELESEESARSGADTTLQQNINTLAGSVYKKTETYSQAEVDAKIKSVDGADSIEGINNEITLIKQEQQTQNTNITNLQNDKVSTTTLSTTLADYAKTSALEPYAKTADVNAELALKATKAELTDYAKTADVNTTLADYAKTSALTPYAKTADVNAELALKATKEELADYATTTAVNTKLADYATTAAVNTALEGKVDNATLNNYATIASVQSDLAKKQGNLTADQLNAVNSGITAAKITAMDKATADAQADADQALLDAAAADAKAVAARGVADAAAEALNSATRISDGNYTLTMKVVGDTVSYGWELIDRGYDSADVTPNNQ